MVYFIKIIGKENFMDIKFENTISVEDFNYLRESVKWNAIEKKLALKGIENALFIVRAIIDGKTIGLTRVSGDGGYNIFITDVIVLPEYQNKGIGKQLMTKAMNFINEKYLEKGQSIFVNLMSAKGRESFYKQFGFEERPNETVGAGMSQWIKKE
jgi:GNAT superfamily N-acetyltransferase